VRVLVAAAGEPGAVAAETLDAAGVSVERVATLADARVRAATVPVAVVGDLRDAGAPELCDRLHDDGVDTPLVGLDDTGEYVVTVDGPADERLPVAVQLAPHVAAYRDAVDDLYERCLRRAEEGDAAVTAARRAATDDLDRARRLAGRTPYESLLED
jgi:uncharacterized phage protein gp47/JayE